MSATARAEGEVWGDWRFHALARELGCEWHAAIGRMLHLWGECTRRTADLDADEPPVYTLTAAVVGAIIGYPPEVATRALVTSCLAEETPEGLRIKGTEGRIEWLRDKRLAGRKGGRRRAKAAGRDGGQFVSVGTQDQTETRHTSSSHQAATRQRPGTPQAATKPTATATATATAPDSAASAAPGFPSLMEAYRDCVRDGAEPAHINAAAGQVGAHLRARRESLHMSQRDLAAKVPAPAFGPRDLGRAERGEHDPGEGTWLVWHEALLKLERSAGPAPNPEHRRFLDEFGELWRAEHKTSGPTWSAAGRLHKDLQAALSIHDCEELLRRARNMFASTVGQFPIMAKSDKAAGTLLRHIDLFVEVRGVRRRPTPARLGEAEDVNVHRADKYREF